MIGGERYRKVTGKVVGGDILRTPKMYKESVG